MSEEPKFKVGDSVEIMPGLNGFIKQAYQYKGEIIPRWWIVAFISGGKLKKEKIGESYLRKL